jgi:hypothetical protein
MTMAPQDQDQAQAGAGFLAQAGAVLRSTASLQRRSPLTNACLLALPLAFCALLFGLQLAVNGALDSRQYSCGCRCTQCCDWAAAQPGGRPAPPSPSLLLATARGPPESPLPCTHRRSRPHRLHRATAGAARQGAAYACHAATPEQPCSPYAACSAFDDGDCGFQHSSYQQAAFCPVQEPPTWPALLQARGPSMRCAAPGAAVSQPGGVG